VLQLGPGDEIGGYRIEAVAGRGGMGVVYRARERRPNRIVAIKVIAPELAADSDFRARFELESNTAAEIEHPNVIPVYGVGEDHGLLFIAMRFVHGIDLGRLLRQTGRLPPQRAAHLIAQVAAALDAAHARGLVHRDVKPGNILVAEDDHVYLTDFGLTKRAADSRGMTKTGMLVGTVDYIAPEQVEGRPVDARTDVYALGCVTYEALSGSVPFPRESEIAKIFAHVNEEPPPLRDQPPPLAAAVERAMAKRPADRFQSAGDFGRAVSAGAVGRAEAGSDRTVATGDAAIADPRAPTVVAGLAQTKPAEGARRGWSAPARETQRTPGRRSVPRWVFGVGAVVLVAVIGGAVAIGAGGSGSRHTTSRSRSTPVTRSTPVNSNRATLPPATVPSKVNECQQQLTFAVDGTAGPLKCANGDLNVIAWRHYAGAAGHLMSVGPFASPPQVLQAMCKDISTTTNPLEQDAYQLAQAYYGWRFVIDPSSAYPSACG
jgi:serine/threonine protein kinase